MAKPQDLLYDKRLLDRHVARGLVSVAERQAHLDGLPDVSDKGAVLKADLTAVGVRHVRSQRDAELAD